MKHDYIVPMSAPDIRPADIELVTRVLQSKTLSMGPYVEEFERAFAAYIGTDHAVAVINGTAGLHLCIRAAGIRDGDEVITTPFSFIASANCIVYEHAVPVFVDIDEYSLNIDSGRARAAVTERTRALLPVHVFGQPCALDDLKALCDERKLILIEDACEAVGAEYRGTKVGAVGDAAVFSFYPNKQITMGEGAVITTNNSRWAARFRSLRNQGRSEMGTWLCHEHLGYNYRLNELCAALGLSQLRRIEELLQQRERVAAHYGELLRNVPGVKPVGILPSTTRMSWFIYAVRFEPKIDRAEIVRHLEAQRVPSRAYFPPIHLQPLYRERFGFREGDFPVTERVAASTLALPFHSNLSSDQIEYVVAALQSAIGCSLA